jgi:hypothetical protein
LFFHQAEKLRRDPLRYVRDPSQLEAEGQPAPQQTGSEPVDKNKTDRKSRTGFNKRLLKSKNGEEQCFEEARAIAGTYKLAVGSASNFNLLHTEKRDQSSQMEIEDEEGSIDISMAESTTRSFQNSTSSKHPFKLQRIGSKTDGRRLFEPNASFEAALNQTAISNASSTINEIDAVGMSTKGEATINTKLAMRELSMMFSSPAFGMEDRKHKDRSMASQIFETNEDSAADRSLGIVGDGLMLDNSICNHRNDGNGEPLDSYGKKKEERNPGFTIFEDDEAEGSPPSEAEPRKEGLGFQIYEDQDSPDHSKVEAKSSSQSSSDEDSHLVDASRYETGDTVSISEAMAVLGEDSTQNDQPEVRESNDGDTATLSLFNEIFQDDGDNENNSKSIMKNEQPPRPFEIFVDHDDQDNQNVS